MGIQILPDQYGLGGPQGGIAGLGSTLQKILQEAASRKFEQQQQQDLFKQKRNLIEEERLREQEATTIVGKILQQNKQNLGEEATYQDRLANLLQTENLTPEARKIGLEALKQQEGAKFAKRFKDGEINFGDVVEGLVLDYLPASFGQEYFKSLGNIPKEKQTEQIANLYNYDPQRFEGVDPSQAYNIASKQFERNIKFDEKIADDIDEFQRNRQAIEGLQSNIEKGALDPGSAANFANALEESGFNLVSRVFRAFESPESAAANAQIKELMAGVQQIVPAKGINVYIEKMFRQMLPLMGRSREANLASLEVFKDFLTLGRLKKEIRDEILLQNNGNLPFNYEQLMRNRLIERGDIEVNKLKNDLEDFHKTFGITEENFPLKEIPPADEHIGRSISDQKGNRFKSDGKKWRKI